jgi:hypothetical protein
MRRHLTRALRRAASCAPAAEPAAAAAPLPHAGASAPLLRAGARALHGGAPWAGGGASWGRVASAGAAPPLRGALLQQRRGMFIQTQPTPNPQRRACTPRAPNASQELTLTRVWHRPCSPQSHVSARPHRAGLRLRGLPHRARRHALAPGAQTLRH